MKESFALSIKSIKNSQFILKRNVYPAIGSSVLNRTKNWFSSTYNDFHYFRNVSWKGSWKIWTFFPFSKFSKPEKNVQRKKNISLDSLSSVKRTRKIVFGVTKTIFVVLVKNVNQNYSWFHETRICFKHSFKWCVTSSVEKIENVIPKEKWREKFSSRVFLFDQEKSI